MTKRDFVKLASIVREQYARNGFDAAVWLCNEFIALSERSNPRFDKERFIQACELNNYPELF